MYRPHLAYSSFNSQASYEARPADRGLNVANFGVSIHRPHTRPDNHRCKATVRFDVSIHRPHTRPDGRIHSTHTVVISFNSQASYEARLYDLAEEKRMPVVSIHRPHTRPDGGLAWKPI